MRAGLLRRLGELWLGKEAAQRLRLRQTSLAMALMALCVPVLHYCVAIAHGERGALLWAWTAVSTGGMALIYAAIRSGWSRRCADPSMTSVQIAFAITCIAAAAAWSARETYRVPMNDLGNPKAKPMDKATYDALRAEVIANAARA